MLISTTSEEYKKYIACDRAMERRFQSIELREPDHERLIRIIERVARVRYPNTEIARDAIEETARLAALCSPERCEPARSLELLHYEISAARISLPPDLDVGAITTADVRRAAALKTGGNIVGEI